jgi:peroxiredoxin Q/BCP
MKLKKGQSPVGFNVKDIYGDTHQLSRYSGRKMLLSFFRNVNCPFCNLRVHELSKMRQELSEAGLVMLFFFESSDKQLKRSVFHQEVSSIPLIGDPEKKIYKKYGVESSALKMMKTLIKGDTIAAMKKGSKFNVPKEKEKHVDQMLIPADFLINEDLIIEQPHYGSNLRDHIPVEEIRRFAGIRG